MKTKQAALNFRGFRSSLCHRVGRDSVLFKITRFVVGTGPFINVH